MGDLEAASLLLDEDHDYEYSRGINDYEAGAGEGLGDMSPTAARAPASGGTPRILIASSIWACSCAVTGVLAAYLPYWRGWYVTSGHEVVENASSSTNRITLKTMTSKQQAMLLFKELDWSSLLAADDGFKSMVAQECSNAAQRQQTVLEGRFETRADEWKEALRAELKEKLRKNVWRKAAKRGTKMNKKLKGSGGDEELYADDDDFFDDTVAEIDADAKFARVKKVAALEKRHAVVAGQVTDLSSQIAEVGGKVEELLKTSKEKEPVDEVERWKEEFVAKIADWKKEQIETGGADFLKWIADDKNIESIIKKMMDKWLSTSSQGGEFKNRLVQETFDRVLRQMTAAGLFKQAELLLVQKREELTKAVSSADDAVAIAEKAAASAVAIAEKARKDVSELINKKEGPVAVGARLRILEDTTVKKADLEKFKTELDTRVTGVERSTVKKADLEKWKTELKESSAKKAALEKRKKTELENLQAVGKDFAKKVDHDQLQSRVNALDARVTVVEEKVENVSKFSASLHSKSPARPHVATPQKPTLASVEATVSKAAPASPAEAAAPPPPEVPAGATLATGKTPTPAAAGATRVTGEGEQDGGREGGPNTSGEGAGGENEMTKRGLTGTGGGSSGGGPERRDDAPPHGSSSSALGASPKHVPKLLHKFVPPTSKNAAKSLPASASKNEKEAPGLLQSFSKNAPRVGGVAKASASAPSAASSPVAGDEGAGGESKGGARGGAGDELAPQTGHVNRKSGKGEVDSAVGGQMNAGGTLKESLPEPTTTGSADAEHDKGKAEHRKRMPPPSPTELGNITAITAGAPRPSCGGPPGTPGTPGQQGSSTAAQDARQCSSHPATSG